MTKYAYYPGCSALKSATEADQAIKLVMTRLGMEWVELTEAACCGSREAGGLEVEDEFLSLAINARTLGLAEAAKAEVMVNICSTCHLKLTGDNKRLQEDAGLLNKINRALEKINLTYNGTVKVMHFLYLVLDDIGLEVLNGTVNRPLTGLNIAPFYGCHLIRPGKVHGYRDDPYDPQSLSEIIEALGGNAVSYSGASKCCGFHAISISEKPALIMSGKNLMEAKDKGAHLLVTPCPLCHTVLDSYRVRINNTINEDIDLPVLHLQQLIGLAQGFDPKELGLERHMVSVIPVLQDLPAAELLNYRV